MSRATLVDAEDYKFARYATEGSSSKVCWTKLPLGFPAPKKQSMAQVGTRLAHIYDLGGDEAMSSCTRQCQDGVGLPYEANENLLGVPVSKATVGNLVLAITFVPQNGRK